MRIYTSHPWASIRNVQALKYHANAQEQSPEFWSRLWRDIKSPSKSGMVETSFLSAFPATAQTRGLSTKVPAMQTFLPLLLPTMKASVTVRAISTSPENDEDKNSWNHKSLTAV